MSEKIVIAQRNLVCDLCGHLIPKGTQCRMIRDDYLRNIVYFEHLQCPTAVAVKTSTNLPKTPNHTHQPEAVLA